MIRPVLANLISITYWSALFENSLRSGAAVFPAAAICAPANRRRSTFSRNHTLAAGTSNISLTLRDSLHFGCDAERAIKCHDVARTACETCQVEARKRLFVTEDWPLFGDRFARSFEFQRKLLKLSARIDGGGGGSHVAGVCRTDNRKREKDLIYAWNLRYPSFQDSLSLSLPLSGWTLTRIDARFPIGYNFGENKNEPNEFIGQNRW